MNEIQILCLVELIFTISAITFGMLCYTRRLPGWMQIPIIMPWLFLKLLFALALLSGLFQPSYTAVYVLLIAGPASITLLFAVRLWKHG